MANFRFLANFRFVTLHFEKCLNHILDTQKIPNFQKRGPVVVCTLQVLSKWKAVQNSLSRFHTETHQATARVTCRFKTFGPFETATAVLIPLQGLEMVWPFRNAQLFLLAFLIPHQFDISGQVCSVAFKCKSCNTIKTYIFIRTTFGLL